LRNDIEVWGLANLCPLDVIPGTKSRLLVLACLTGVARSPHLVQHPGSEIPVPHGVLERLTNSLAPPSRSTASITK